MKRKSIFILVMFCFVILIAKNNTRSVIDFKKNYKYYEQTCSKRTSYETNKQACLEFEDYKKENNSSLKEQDRSLTDSTMDGDKLAKLIQKNEKIINKKKKEKYLNEKKSKENAKKITQLEKDVLNSLSTMQYFSDENQIIDIVMSSSNLEDLMRKVEGISTINNVNIQNISDLEKMTKELEDTQLVLQNETDKLEKTRIKQKKMLREFRRNEADLYNKANSGGSGAVYNDKLEELDLSKINDTSKNWGKPVKKGVITASTWYYPGGGWHPGIDVGLPVGSKVIAPANGILLGTANSSSGYGKHIVTAFKKGDYVYTMIFAHLSDFVGVNGFKKGQQIGVSGNTGASTGPHTHIEIFRHDTGSLKTVANAFKKGKDYWFGLGYSGKGKCTGEVCRLQPADEFKIGMNENF